MLNKYLNIYLKREQFSNFSYIIKSQQHFHYFILMKKYVQWFTIDFYFSLHGRI